jgi:dolichyl-phosphate beta-glucosyltransferase
VTLSTGPMLSVVIPAFNEEARLAATLDAWRGYLERRAVSWEIVVVDDGSQDGTREIVAVVAAADPRVRLLARPHAGKGAAVRTGMLSALGEWRFMADADMSMRPQEFDRFFDAAGQPRFAVAVGSREGVGARRVAEPMYRHLIGRTYNWLVRLMAISGINDTQCGYKLFTRSAAEALFTRQKLDGFGFDVEVLFLARRLGYGIGEVAITWHYDPDSRVSFKKGLDAFVDIVRVRINAWLGRYGSSHSTTADSRVTSS